MQLTYIEAPTGYTRPANEVHTEYPKFLHFPDKPSVIVQDAAEEQAVLAGAAPKPAPVVMPPPVAPIPSLMGKNDEEAMLREIAAQRNIRIDGRWKLPRIRKELEKVMGASEA